MSKLDPVRYVAKNMRLDLALIAEMIEPRARVLDIGCGDGMLIEHLFRTKQCDARGIEIDMADVTRAVAHGLPVMHGDADLDLAHYPDAAFDYVVLSRTLQAVERPREVLRQMLRIGTRAVVSFPNFGHWLVRWQLVRTGRMPVDRHLGPRLVRDPQHPPLHVARLLRSLRPGGLHGRALARRRRYRRAGRRPGALASVPRACQSVRRTGAVPAAPRLRPPFPGGEGRGEGRRTKRREEADQRSPPGRARDAGRHGRRCTLAWPCWRGKPSCSAPRPGAEPARWPWSPAAAPGMSRPMPAMSAPGCSAPPLPATCSPPRAPTRCWRRSAPSPDRRACC